MNPKTWRKKYANILPYLPLYRVVHMHPHSTHRKRNIPIHHQKNMGDYPCKPTERTRKSTNRCIIHDLLAQYTGCISGYYRPMYMHTTYHGHATTKMPKRVKH